MASLSSRCKQSIDVIPSAWSQHFTTVNPCSRYKPSNDELTFASLQHPTMPHPCSICMPSIHRNPFSLAQHRGLSNPSLGASPMATEFFLLGPTIHQPATAVLGPRPQPSNNICLWLITHQQLTPYLRASPIDKPFFARNHFLRRSTTAPGTFLFFTR